MRKTMLIGLAVISILSCSQSPQNEVNALIRKNVEKTLSHPESYEALQTVVDSAFAPFDDPAFFEKTLEICKMNIEEESDSLAAKIAERGQELIAMMGTEYRFIGYKVTHSYSARDDEGVTFTGEKVYIMDKDMKNVLAEYDTDSMDYIMVQAMYILWRYETFYVLQK